MDETFVSILCTIISSGCVLIGVLVSNKNTWTNLGNQIGEAINGLFDSMNEVDPTTGLTGWQASAKSISSIANGILTTFIKAVQKVEWKQVGKSISDFFTSIDWGELAKNVSKLTKGIFNALADAIRGVNWDEVGKKIADFIKNIDWIGVITSLGNLALAIGGAIVKAIKSLWENGDVLTKIGVAIVTLLGLAKLTGSITGLASKVSTLIGSSIGVDATGTYTFKLFKLAVWIGTAVLTWKVGTSVGSWLGEKLAELFGDEEVKKYYQEYDTWDKCWPELKRAWEEGNFWDGVGLMLEDAFGSAGFEKKLTEIHEKHKEEIDAYLKAEEYNLKYLAEQAKQLAENFKNAMTAGFYGTTGIHFQDGVTYELDNKGGVKYAYQNQKDLSKDYSDTKMVIYLEGRLEGY